MANRKISDLTALTAPAVGDLLPIVDISEAAAADKNKRITLGTLLGGAPLGTAAAPTFAFSGYPSTGIYSPGADQLAISTGGTGRITVDASGNVNIDSNTLYVDAVNNRVGVGTTGPAYASDVRTTGTSISSSFTSDQSEQYIALKDSGTTLGHVRLGSTSGSLLFFAGNGERARIDSSGRLLVGGSPDSGGALLQVFGDRIRVGTAKTPASASATGTTGEICWDANYIYVCTATNTWKRTAIATW